MHLDIAVLACKTLWRASYKDVLIEIIFQTLKRPAVSPIEMSKIGDFMT